MVETVDTEECRARAMSRKHIKKERRGEELSLGEIAFGQVYNMAWRA